MTIKALDRLFETTTSTGTTAITLLGAVSGFRAFSVAGNGSKIHYQINDGDANGLVTNWEIGIGTVNTATNQISRDTILSSSNSNAVVNFGAGTKNVLGSVPASLLTLRDENLNDLEHFGTGGGTANAHTFTYLNKVPLAYSDGMEISWFPTATNTGAATVNVNTLGAKSLKLNGTDPAAGVITSGTYIKAVYKVASGWFEIISSQTVSAGSTTVAGTVRLATTAETQAGSLTTVGVTPGGMKAALGVSNFYESAQQTITAAGALTLAHGLGVVPKFIQVMLVCQTVNNNYAVNDVLFVNPMTNGDGASASRGVAVVPDATNLNIRYGSNANTFVILDKSTGASNAITNANWKIIIRAWG